MKSYGETFRKIREEKGYSMKQVAEGIVSISFLSKFERGDSDISLSLFVQLLDRLFLSFDEFEFLHLDHKTSEMERFFQASNQAYLSRDLKSLRILKEEELEKWRRTKLDPYRCNAIMIQVYEGIIKEVETTAREEDLDFLYHYLFKVEVWGYYELFLYNSTILLLQPEMVLHLSDIVYKNRKKVEDHKKLKDLMIRIFLNTLIFLTGGENPDFLYQKECLRFFNYLEEIDIPEEDLAARNEVIYLQGIYLLRIGQRKEGKEKIEESIERLQSLGAHQSAKYREDYYKLLKERHL